MARRNRKPTRRAAAAEVARAPGIEVSRGVYVGGLVTLLLVGAALRIWAARGELWLDEIWSLLEFADTAKSPADIFTFHHDNNHYLTTLWMYLLGPKREPWIWFRLPSLLTGIGTVALLPVAARRWGSLASVIATLVGALSLVLIQYASEARGYAPVGFFALAAFVALDRYLREPKSWALAAFIVSSVLGILSHLTMIEISLAAIVWSAVHCWRQPALRRTFLRQMLMLHLVPVLLIALLYQIDIRAMHIGGGEASGMAQVVAEAMALALGALKTPMAVAIVVAVIAAVIAAVAMFWLARDRDDVWVFYVMAIFVAPIVAVVTQRSTTLFERYFYVNILFYQLLLSFVLSRLAQLGRAGRAVAVAAIALYVLGNGSQTGEFLRVGRGHFVEILQYLSDHSVNPQVHIYNNGHRTQTVLYTQFYALQVPLPRFVFDKWVPNMRQPPEWALATSRDHNVQFAEQFNFRGSREVYVLERVYPYAGLSGFHFAVYHREADRQRAEESAPTEPEDP